LVTPLTITGTALGRKVPLPSFPVGLSPQHQAVGVIGRPWWLSP